MQVITTTYIMVCTNSLIGRMQSCHDRVLQALASLPHRSNSCVKLSHARDLGSGDWHPRYWNSIHEYTVSLEATLRFMAMSASRANCLVEKHPEPSNASASLIEQRTADSLEYTERVISSPIDPSLDSNAHMHSP
ncbi:hypothetical protein NX059_005579 [Plenodomus lindquistii]|nr:hypothetical protein NX059_005579 [Plenodomus lindquistii]